MKGKSLEGGIIVSDLDNLYKILDSNLIVIYIYKYKRNIVNGKMKNIDTSLIHENDKYNEPNFFSPKQQIK